MATVTRRQSPLRMRQRSLLMRRRISDVRLPVVTAAAAAACRHCDYTTADVVTAIDDDDDGGGGGSLRQWHDGCSAIACRQRSQVHVDGV